jgi:hypothetical protein
VYDGGGGGGGGGGLKKKKIIQTYHLNSCLLSFHYYTLAVSIGHMWISPLRRYSHSVENTGTKYVMSGA